MYILTLNVSDDGVLIINMTIILYTVYHLFQTLHLGNLMSFHPHA